MGKGVAAVDRAVDILRAFPDDGRAMSLVELSEATGLYKSTILRLCDSLERHSLIFRAEDGRFRLGNGLIRLGEVAKRSQNLRPQIYLVLQELVDQTGESASFYVLHEGKRLCLCRVDSPKSVRDHIREGDILPVNVGASGRVLQRYVKSRRGMTDQTAGPILVSMGERDAEIAAVAGPVADATGFIGALSISGPIGRFDDRKIRAFSRAVKAACQRLSHLSGGDFSRFEADRANKPEVTA